MTDFAAWGKFDADAAAEVVDREADREQKKRELRATEASAAAQDVSHMHQTHSLECDCIPLRSFGALHTCISTAQL
eukprot:20480-Heterococcus_DN1.PRE.1